jgi:serine protease Do
MNNNDGRTKSIEFKKAIMVAVLCSLIGALAATVVTTGILYGGPAPERKPQVESEPEVIQTQEAQIPVIAREVTPAVVGISTTRIDYDFFYRPIKSEAVGSGIIVNRAGYILTNDHVVGNADEITVFLSDARKYMAKKVYTDPALDLAVIKINAPNLVAAKIGDSDKVVVGDLAVAIGNPLGLSLQRTVTAGIISALNRTVGVEDHRGRVLMQDLIQTDASINPGNSGGPLVNGKGEVIGINTIKASQAESIGFAIPINIAKPIVDSIVEKGRFEKPYLGIDGIDKEMAKLMNINVNVDSGIYVAQVEENSPAYKAGIRPKDIITELAGQRVESMAKLRQVLYNLDIGQNVEVKILRAGRRLTRQLRVSKQ